MRIVTRARLNLRVPKNLSYNYNIRSLLLTFSIFQIISRLVLAINYSCMRDFTFNLRVENWHNINNNWLLRLIHINRASFIILTLFMHFAIKLFYRSFSKRIATSVRLISLILIVLIAFLRYVLPWRQISFWRCTVITSIVSVVPFFREDLCYLIWRNYSVTPTILPRLYVAHFLLPIVLIRLIRLHFYFIHNHRSSNPLRQFSVNKLTFYYFFIIKDTITVLLLLRGILLVLNGAPIFLQDPENWWRANNIVTPAHIKPEWYFLSFYRILRSIPNKTLRVLVILRALLVHFLWVKFCSHSYMYNKLMFSILFSAWIFNFLLLIVLRRCEVTEIFSVLNQGATIAYFSFIILFCDTDNIVK